MRIIFSCIVLLACLPPGKLAAQTARPDPFTVTDKVVEYDYGRKVFTTVLPFDDPFTLKIVKLPKDISNLYITFYEIRGNYNLFKKKDDDSITEEQFKALKKIKKYALNRWIRTNDSTFAYIPIPFSLQPNAKYVFSMENETRRALADAEKETVRTIIINDNDISDFLNNMSRTYIGTRKALGNIQKEGAALTDIVKKSLKQNDTALRFDPPADNQHRIDSSLMEFVLALKGYYDRLNAIAADSLSPSDTSNIVKQKVLIAKRLAGQRVNWWQIAHDPSRASRVLQELNSINTSTLTPPQKQDIADANEALNDAVKLLNQIATDMVQNAIMVHVYKSSGMAPTYFVNMVDQANWYIGLDVGYAYIGNFSRFVTYSGLNIYFRPVNKNIPLSRYKNVWDIVATRASLLVGVTVGSIEKANVRKGIVGNSGIILGTGFRLNSWFRINGGALLYYRYDGNPIMNNDRYSAKASPFISASIDIDVQQLLGALGTSIFKTTP